MPPGEHRARLVVHRPRGRCYPKRTRRPPCGRWARSCCPPRARGVCSAGQPHRADVLRSPCCPDVDSWSSPEIESRARKRGRSLAVRRARSHGPALAAAAPVHRGVLSGAPPACAHPCHHPWPLTALANVDCCHSPALPERPAQRLPHRPTPPFPCKTLAEPWSTEPPATRPHEQLQEMEGRRRPHRRRPHAHATLRRAWPRAERAGRAQRERPTRR